MKLQVINHVDIESFEKGITKTKPDYIIMNEQTKIEIACHSNGYLVTYNGNIYRYRQYPIAIYNGIPDGEVVFVKEV